MSASSSTPEGLAFFHNTSNNARRPKTVYKYDLWERKFMTWLTLKYPAVLDNGVPQCLRLTDDILFW